MEQSKIVVKGIPRFPDYQFGEDGCVVSHVFNTPRILKPIKMGQYQGLQLRSADGTARKEYVHRLIAEAFHGPCESGLVCCHLNGNRFDNRAANLMWASQSQNNLHKAAHGTSPDGARNPMAKLSRAAVDAMRAARERTGASYAAIAKEFGVSTMTAFRAVSGQSWRNA